MPDCSLNPDLSRGNTENCSLITKNGADPIGTFFGTIQFIGMKRTKEAVAEALELSSMDKLKKYEKKYGFKEKPANAKNFFREGKTGRGKGLLTEDHIKSIIEANGEVMKKYGYL
ncbi:MAG: sulfotransferase domain-containing protein [bacterium]|nr:sulfotransferase domain-containing protein [bacterium]